MLMTLPSKKEILKRYEGGYLVRKSAMLSLVSIFLSLMGRVSMAGELIIPKDTWEPIYFQSINKVTNQAKLKSLRSYFVNGDDLEIRFWSGFGLQPLGGFILKRSNGTWSGLCITENFRKEGPPIESRSVTPQQGWDYLWQRLSTYGIMTLPDSSQLKDEARVMDGVSYVVELNHRDQYRTYQYGNPYDQPWPEAIQIQKIAHLLNKELLGKDDQGEGRAIPQFIKDGEVVLVRKGKAYGGFILKNQQPSKGAAFEWIYREDGISDFSRRGAIKGTDVIKGDPGLISFGPFSVRWSYRTEGESYLYYPDPKLNPRGIPNRLFIAVTHEKDFNLNAADSKWNYKAAHIEYEE